MKYDSKADTLEHIRTVNKLTNDFIALLNKNVAIHDDSKLHSPEKEAFDKYTPMLRDTTYGSDKYFKFLNEMKPAVDHHQKNNPHHPEFFDNGIDGMSLLNLVEMFIDWKAASLRHNDGDIRKSIDFNKERHDLSDQLASIFHNTVNEMNWV